MTGEYYKTKESVDEYIQLAKDVNGSNLIIKLREYLSPGSSLLELGSGPGTDWKILNEHYEVTGSDFSREFLDRLRKTIPKGRFLELDASTIKTEQKFDGIYSNKVLHHLNDDNLLLSIQRQSEVLKSGGIICHSFWKGEGSEFFKGLFVNYHTEQSLETSFGPYFKILIILPYQEFEEGDSILLIAQKAGS